MYMYVHIYINIQIDTFLWFDHITSIQIEYRKNVCTYKYVCIYTKCCRAFKHNQIQYVPIKFINYSLTMVTVVYVYTMI